MSVPESAMETLPVKAPEPPVDVTVAVRVTLPPTACGLGEPESVRVVAGRALLMVSMNGALVLLA